jgi:hypothetical protein
MSVNGKSFTTDTFVISRNIDMHVGFNCEDSVLIEWNKVEGADHYQVYSLGTKFLEPYIRVSDTFLVFAKNNINSKFFTIAPTRGADEGMKAFTLNYETQGVGCYIRNFLAQLNNDKAFLILELGNVYHLKQIEIQKDAAGSFSTLQAISNPTQLNFQFDNLNLHQGVNRFRAKLTLVDGKVVYSPVEIIFYTGNKDFLVYPNPTSASVGFNVLRRDVEEETLVLSDLYGRRIMRITLQDIINPVATSSLQRGVYFIAIFDKNGNRTFNQKVVIQ